MGQVVETVSVCCYFPDFFSCRLDQSACFSTHFSQVVGQLPKVSHIIFTSDRRPDGKGGYKSDAAIKAMVNHPNVQVILSLPQLPYLSHNPPFKAISSSSNGLQ